MLEIRQLAVDYQYDAVFENINAQLRPGELLYLKGSNGSGKTTLLKVLAGLVIPRSGDILWQGESIFSQLREYQQQLIYVGHKTGLNPILTVRENCQFDCDWRIGGKTLEGILKQFGLEGFEDKICSQLSQGQRRRVALLRLLMSSAPIWLLDEPFTAIDTKTQKILLQHITLHLAQGGIAIMSSHQPLTEVDFVVRELNL